MAAKNQINLFDLALRALPLYEDPTGTARPLWRDLSKHNGYSDLAISRANGVAGIAARSGISWGYADPLFSHNWIGAGLNGLYRTSYHVLYAGQPVIPQADNWYTIHPWIETIPRIIDLEVRTDGLDPWDYAQSTAELSDLILSRDGVRPIIYSRYLLVNEWLSPYWDPDYLNDHYFILAQYLWDRTREHPGPPTFPNGLRRERVILHQTADKKAGYPGEVESSAADYDRWEIGNRAEMDQWIRETWGGVIDPPEPPPDHDHLLNLTQRQEADKLYLEIEVTHD